MDNYLTIFIIQAYSKMLLMSGTPQRTNYAARLINVIDRMERRRPDGTPIWQLFRSGALAALNGDELRLLTISMTVATVTDELKSMLKGS